MITNFEEITKPLTKDEMKYVDWLKDGFKNLTKESPMLTPDIVKMLNEKRYLYKIKTKMTPARLRKIVNHLNGKAEIVIVGTSKGYFSTTDTEEIRKSIKSKRERSTAIDYAADGQQKVLYRILNGATD